MYKVYNQNPVIVSVVCNGQVYFLGPFCEYLFDALPTSFDLGVIILQVEEGGV